MQKTTLISGFIAVMACVSSMAKADVAREESVRASFYQDGARTASGEKFNPGGLTAAHRTLPFGTRLKLVNKSNGKAVIVRVNDRGPFIQGRNLDVSRGAAVALGMVGSGVTTLQMTQLTP